MCFRDSCVIEDILAEANKLKDTELGISRDYPREINEARKSLWTKLKKARNEGKKRVALQYPAKLVINEIVVEDRFPNWMHFIRGNYKGDHMETKMDEKPSSGSVTGDSDSSSDQEVDESHARELGEGATGGPDDIVDRTYLNDKISDKKSDDTQRETTKSGNDSVNNDQNGYSKSDVKDVDSSASNGQQAADLQ